MALISDSEAMSWPSKDIRIQQLDVDGHVGGVFDPLTVSFTFDVSEDVGPLENARWDFVYLFDIVFEKQSLSKCPSSHHHSNGCLSCQRREHVASPIVLCDEIVFKLAIGSTEKASFSVGENKVQFKVRT